MEKKEVDQHILCSECPHIFSMDLSAPKEKLTRANPELAPNIDEVEMSYKMFLWRSITGENQHVEPAVDSLWHMHILHTELYYTHCRDVLGVFLHHCPS
jgi:hypothetical protein